MEDKIQTSGKRVAFLQPERPNCCKKGGTTGCCLLPGETCHTIQAQWDAIDSGTMVIVEEGGKKWLYNVKPPKPTAASRAFAQGIGFPA